MRKPFLVGERLYLRFPEECDIGEEYLGWLNDQEVTRYLETGKFPATYQGIRRYLEHLASYPHATEIKSAASRVVICRI